MLSVFVQLKIVWKLSEYFFNWHVLEFQSVSNSNRFKSLWKDLLSAISLNTDPRTYSIC